MNFEKVILWQVGARERAKRNDKGSKVSEKRRARRKAKGTGESVARARTLSLEREQQRASRRKGMLGFITITTAKQTSSVRIDRCQETNELISSNNQARLFLRFRNNNKKLQVQSRFVEQDKQGANHFQTHIHKHKQISK